MKSPVIKIHNIAHYGRWFPYEKRTYPLWWFDSRFGKMIGADELCCLYGCSDPCELDAAECEYGGYISCFRVDIPELEIEYAGKYLSQAEQKSLLSLDRRSMDRLFRRIIEENGLTRHWYDYELAALSAAAEAWCVSNHIPYLKQSR